MLSINVIRASTSASIHSQLAFLPNYRAYSTKYSSASGSEEADLDAARQWYQRLGKTFTLPTKIARTTFSRSSGPGGQKVNKFVSSFPFVETLANLFLRTSSKALTEWPIADLLTHVPKVLHQGLKDSRYYVASSQSIKIQCDTHRGQTENEAETHKRLGEEISKVYAQRVPGVTNPETKKRVEQL